MLAMLGQVLLQATSTGSSGSSSMHHRYWGQRKLMGGPGLERAQGRAAQTSILGECGHLCARRVPRRAHGVVSSTPSAGRLQPALRPQDRGSSAFEGAVSPAR